MKKAFLVLRHHLPPIENLNLIVHQVTKSYLETDDVIDSPTLVKIVLESVFGWIFEQEFKPEDLELVSAATWEWRKELAIKGNGDLGLKKEAVRWIKEVIRASKYYDIFGDKWEEPEFWSLFLQPFFISPAINVTDIAVTLASSSFRNELKKLGVALNQETPLSESVIFHAVNLSNPFPILERWFPDGLLDVNLVPIVKPNTQVFLPLDEIGPGLKLCHSSSWAAFGAGKRACAGRDIALVLCVQLFSKLMSNPKFQPQKHHVYSGRNNDLKESWSQSFFQIKTALRIFAKLLKARLCDRFKLLSNY
jgi:hypothetical protein